MIIERASRDKVVPLMASKAKNNCAFGEIVNDISATI